MRLRHPFYFVDSSAIWLAQSTHGFQAEQTRAETIVRPSEHHIFYNFFRDLCIFFNAYTSNVS